MAEYEAVIGLEVHVRARDRDEAVLRMPQRVRRRAEHPRLPGVPRAARLAAGAERARSVEYRAAARRGPALRRARASIFSRKNYFYPGHAEGLPDLAVRRADLRRRVARGRRRPHRHRARAPRGGHRARRPTSVAAAASTTPTTRLVDYNRAGVPLMEIVSRPDIRSAEQAKGYVSELRAVLEAIGVSDVKMEGGSMRVDANVSVRPVGAVGAGREGRGQEHELAPVARTRHRLRDGTPDRGGRGG